MVAVAGPAQPRAMRGSVFVLSGGVIVYGRGVGVVEAVEDEFGWLHGCCCFFSLSFWAACLSCCVRIFEGILCLVLGGLLRVGSLYLERKGVVAGGMFLSSKVAGLATFCSGRE